jgi:hypothetical protein
MQSGISCRTKYFVIFVTFQVNILYHYKFEIIDLKVSQHYAEGISVVLAYAVYKNEATVSYCTYYSY